MMPDFKLHFSKYSVLDLEPFQTIELFQLFRVYTSHPRLLNRTKKTRIHPISFRNKSGPTLSDDARLQTSFFKIFSRGSLSLPDDRTFSTFQGLYQSPKAIKSHQETAHTPPSFSIKIG